MLTLSLLRHAKSSWKDPTLADHERPLNTRGQAEAPVMGKAMAEHGLDPDLVLCSTARRTRDTLALVLPELRTEPKVVYEDGLYHGDAAEMLEHPARGQRRGEPRPAGRAQSGDPGLRARSDRLGREASQGSARGRSTRPRGSWCSASLPAPGRDVAVNSGKLELFLTPRRREEELTQT